MKMVMIQAHEPNNKFIETDCELADISIFARSYMMNNWPRANLCAEIFSCYHQFCFVFFLSEDIFEKMYVCSTRAKGNRRKKLRKDNSVLDQKGNGSKDWLAVKGGKEL